MKKKYSFIILLFLSTLFSFGQTISSFTPDNSCAGSGTTVIITGTDLTGTTNLDFNGTAVTTFTVNSNTQITATLPNGTTTGKIKVTTSLGSGTSVNDFTVNPNITPLVSITAIPGSTICAGTTVTFTATPSNEGSSPTYKWYVGTTIVGTNSATYTTSSLTNNNQVKVEMTSSATCPVPATVTSNVITMTVNAFVVPSVTISATQTTFCTGTSVAFSVNTLFNGGLNPTYQWRVNGNPVGTSSNFSTTSLVHNDIITLDVTSSASCPSPSMVTSNAVQVTVNPDAVISLSSAVGTNNQTLCANSVLTPITYNISGGGTGAVVTGLPPGLTSSFSGGVFTINGTPTASGSFSYIVTTTGTCVQTTATGTINVSPIAAIILTSGSGTNIQTSCINTAIGTITFAISGGGTGAGVTGLPTGLTGVFNGGTFTISGTPTASGSFPYTVTTTGSCTQATATGTITVNPDAAISLASGAGTENQTLCADTLLPNISFTLSGGGTGAIVTGLPSGVSGNFSGNSFTISGTPTVSGTFPYTVTTTGSCVQTTATGTIIVNPNATINLASTSGSNNQTRCINIAISTITFNVSGGATGAGVIGLPSGLSGSFSGGAFTISGTPTVIGTFPYTVATTGSCTQATATGTITVTPNAAISLTSGAGTINQTGCINTAISTITFAVSGGGTGANVTGLPAGVAGNFNGGTFTINGTPTVSGAYTYTITTTGTCVQTTASGTITVNPDAAISLTSGGSTNIQTRCINVAISNITYLISGGGTGAAATGLPAGVNGTFSGGVFTISGTPAATGTFNYTVTTTGTCSQTSTIGTITVNPNAAITLTSVAGTNNQTRCVNVAIANITFAISGGGTGATVTGLPSGVTGAFNAGTFTISGTPTAIGTFNYTVTTTGTCSQTTATGTITVNPDAAINLTSGTGTNNQTRCINTAISNITFAVSGGGTGAGIIGLPAGLTGIFSGGIFTISGSPTAAGTFNYTVTTTGACNQTTATGIITINPVLVPSVSITSSSTSICSSTGNSVTFTATPSNGGITPTYQWRRNGTNIAGATSASYTTTLLANPSDITVVMTSNATCALPLTATSNGINMNVYSSTPSVGNGNTDNNKPSGPTSICPPATGLVYSIPTNMVGGETYVWSLPNGFNIISGAGTSQITVSVAANATIGNNDISVTAFNPCGNSGASRNLVVSVNSFNGVTVPSATQSVCSNGSITVVGTLTGVAASGTWSATSGAFSNIINDYVSTPKTVTATYTPSNPTGNVTLTITTNTPSGTGCINVAGTAQINVTVNQLVAITAQPITTQTLCSGSTANFNVTATGTGLTYQWKKAGTNLVNGGNISGATSSTLTLTNIAAADAANYSVVVSGSTPCSAVTSTVAGLAVNQRVAISTQPAVTQTVCTGNSVSFSTTATGTGLTYQWRKGATNLSNTGNVSGATSNILTINPVVSADAASDYNVVITGTAPCTPATSNNAALVVNDAVAITIQPVLTQTICSGTNASISVTATGTGLTYQWRKGTSNLSNTGNITGATTATLNLSNVATSDAGSYNVIVSGASPCASVPSNNATLVVNQTVAISTQPAITQTVCTGNSVSFSTTATGTGLTYQWRKGATNLSDTGNISGATTNILTINPVVSADAASDYNVVITGTAPCTPATSINAALVVNEAVAITIQPALSQTICSGTNASFSVVATGTGLTYQWRKGTTNLINTGNISGATTATLNLSNVATSDAGNYNVVVSGASPCATVPSNNATLVVNQTVAISTQPAITQTVCTGNSVSFSTTATGTGLTYQWRKGATNLSNTGNISGATSNILTINPVFSADAASDYNVVITGTAPCTPATSNNAALVVNDAVAITIQAALTQTICSGTNASFNVVATGTGLTYQWRKGTTNLSNTGNISGATTATLNLSNVATSDAGSYNVVVSGTSPCAAVTSNASALVVNEIVAITTQPAVNQTICSGTSVSFSVSATGSGLNYQWRKGTTNLTNGGSITGATTATLTINPTNAGDAASDYNVVITGTAPCNPLTSNNAAIVVNEAIAITTQPAATQTLCSGNSATFNVLATGTGLNYQWRKGTTNLVDGGNIAGATSPTLTISSLQTADAANNYNVVITGTSPCSPVTSANSVLIVNRLVAINTQPSNVGVCASTPATLGLVASGDGLTYQWYKGTIGNGVALVNSSNINGANSNILNFIQASLTDDGPYYAIVSGISPCAIVTSNQVTLNVDQSIIITSQPVTQSVCEDTANVNFSVTANAGGDPLTYQWRKNGSNIAGATASTFTIPTASLLTAANYDVLITGPSGYTCSSVQSATAILTVKPKPIGSAIAQTVCSDSSTNVSFNSTVTGSTFTWTAAIQTAPTGGTINGHSDSSGLSIAQTLKNTGTTAGIIRYTVIPTANSCVGAAFTVDVTVNPAPVGSATAQTICSGSTTSVALNSTVIGTTFTWTAAIQTNPAGGTINGYSSGTENTISQTLTNNGTTAGIIRYTVIPTANSCTGTAFTVDVTINPNSTIVLSSVSGSDNPTNCVNTVLNISYAIGGGGTNASITAGALPAGITGSYNAGTRVFTISGNPTAVGTFNYTVTTQGICSNESLSGTITVNPDSTINLSLGAGSDNQTKCINSAITPIKYTINNGGNNPTISWNTVPTGITGSYDVSAGVYTISGTPTISGTFNYTITTAGTCINSSLSGTIIVNPEPVGSATAQTICSASATSVALISNLSNTTYNWIAAIQASPTGGTITGFSNNSGNTIVETLSNTGTTPAIVRYTVTPKANSCPGGTFTVDVTVNPTAQVNQPSSQVICHNAATSAINFVTINSGGATTYTWANNNPSIGLAASGTGNIPSFTATNSGTSPATATVVVTPNYNNGSINCSGPSKTFTIIVNANSAMNLSSATGTNTQTICINNPISSITYVIGGGGTGASITAGSLPTGVTGFYNAGVFTISGTPSVSGTFNYTLTTSGPCSNVSLTGSIIITALPVATFTYPASAYCITSPNPLPLIPLGSQTGNFTSTAGLSITSATGLINLAASTPGTYTVTNTIPAAAGCPAVSASTTVRIDPVPIGGKLSFGAAGRLLSICQNPSSGYAVPLTLSGIVGTIVQWQYRTSAATSWSVIPGGSGNFTGTTLSAAQIENILNAQKLPNGNLQSIVIRVEITSGACLTNVFSDTAIISVIPQDIAPSPVAVNKSVICIGAGIQLSSETGYGASFGKFEGGAFDNSSITSSGWRITDQAGNTGYNFSSNADNIRPDKWLRTNPHDFITANIFSPYTIYNTRWDTSLSSAGNKGFAIVSGNNTSTLETAIFSLAALDEAILTFDQAYNLTPGAVIRVEISTNGGASYSSEPILFQQSGSVSSGNYDHFGQGTPGVNQMEIDLGDYIGYSNLRIRFNFIGKRDGDVWTLDNIKVPEGPRDVNLVWTDYTDPANPIVIGTTNNVTWTPTKIGWNTFVVKTSLILDSAGNTCSSPVNQKEIKVFAFDQYTTTTIATAVGCGTKNVPLSVNVIGGKQGPITSYPTADGYVGEWSITGPAGFVLSNPNPSNPIAPINNPNAIFTASDIGSYIFKWILVPTTKDENGLTITNTNCTPNYLAPTLILQHCTTLDFDGIDDYVDLGTGFNGAYSVEAWIRPKTGTGTIISGPSFEIKMSDLPGGITPNSRWYHIAMSNGKIYVDGIEMKNAGTGIGGTKTIIGARWNNSSGKPENYFTGWIEEVRIWNKNITQEQIRFMMNQHLQNAANIGVEIPIPVQGGLVYSDLAGYYRLISEFPDSANLETFSNALKPVNGLTPNLAISGTPAVLYNMTTHQQNTAPMPYISKADGKWTDINTWLRPTVWDIPNSNGVNASPIDWNVVITRNNITSDAKDITVLGLKSESGKLTMADPAPAPQNETNGGRMLWITHYLKLDGNIDLVGESQLLQKRYGSYNSDFYFSTTQISESIFDGASSGFIKRDQQGKKNSFNYNYWSSPVTLQGNPNNAPYTIAGVLRDGTVSAIPKAINFQYGAYDADGAVTSPIKTTYRWIWSYNSLTPDSNTDWQNYYQWNYVGTNAIKVGNGFTMKGSGGTADINVTQNYAFIGKPNSGDIDLTIPLNQTYLIGNPYSSALDANQFIRDNLKDCVNCPAAGGFTGTTNAFNGALYFWDHFGLSNNHILAQYEGGYATYTLMGGSPGVSDSPLTATATNIALLAPKRYIPVGQGFFVNAATDPKRIGTSAAVQGGTIKIRNNQRVYYRETSPSSIFLKTAATKKSAAIKIPEDYRLKIRLGFDAPNGKHRQLLLGADPNTTNQFDIGYDAEMFDTKDNDMYWEIEDNQFVIQGIPNFNDNQIIPIGIKIAKEGLSTIKIDALENIPQNLGIYLYDDLTGNYHDIKKKEFPILLEVGSYTNRFSLRFTDRTLSVDEFNLSEGILVYFTKNNKILNIENNFIEGTVDQIFLFNLLGQSIANWDVKERNQNNIQIPIKNMPSGVYIVKLKTTNGDFSKKIIIP